MPSFATIGSGCDNATMESSWSSPQVELLNRKGWRTRIELVTAVFDCVDVLGNRQRRHPRLDHVSPVEREPRYDASVPAWSSRRSG